MKITSIILLGILSLAFSGCTVITAKLSDGTQVQYAYLFNKVVDEFSYDTTNAKITFKKSTSENTELIKSVVGIAVESAMKGAKGL